MTWKKGDTVWGARIEYDGGVDVGSAVVASAGASAVRLGRYAGGHFEYGTRFRQGHPRLHATRESAIQAVVDGAYARLNNAQTELDSVLKWVAEDKKAAV